MCELSRNLRNGIQNYMRYILVVSRGDEGAQELIALHGERKLWSYVRAPNDDKEAFAEPEGNIVKGNF